LTSSRLYIFPYRIFSSSPHSASASFSLSFFNFTRINFSFCGLDSVGGSAELLEFTPMGRNHATQISHPAGATNVAAYVTWIRQNMV
jgi:hypothetical protein